MKQLPDKVRSYRRTAEFTAETVPDALLCDHATKPGVWGLIHVLDGRLRYEVSSTGEAIDLSPADPPAAIEPEVRHRVVPLGGVRFYVEFWR